MNHSSRKGNSAIKPGAPSPLLLLLLSAAVWLGGCTSVQESPFPPPLREPKPAPEVSYDTLPPEDQEPEEADTTFEATPLPPGTIINIAAGQDEGLGSDLEGEPIQTSFNGAPLVAFINEVLGNQLGLSFIIAPEVQNSDALVTLRLTEPLPPAEYFTVVRSVLGQYGIGLIEQDGVINVITSQNANGNEIPLLISGRTSPDVPLSHRTIFQLVPLRVTTPRNVTGWFSQIFPGRELLILDDGPRNSVVLKGRQEQIAQAVEMINVLDQPAFRARNSIMIEPVFLKPRVLARSLEQVLKAEGYEIGLQPGYGVATLLALDDVGKLAVFAGDAELVEHIRDWVEVLDDQQRDSIEEGIFTYQVINVQAAELLESLNGILGGTGGGASPPSAPAGGAAAGSSFGGASGSDRVFAEEKRNILVYKGSGREWGELLSLIRLLDKPIPSVLIEVLIAEITLDKDVNSGVEFLANFNAVHRNSSIDVGTTGFNVPASGLSLVLDRAGTTRARLNLFQSNRRVSIRSSPRLLVRSGASATIEVGNEIPVITQREATGVQTGGTSSVLQQVTYRKTGVQLDISPLVQANGLVDLEISQTLSEARPSAGTSAEGSPTILNRSLNTELSLRDGGSLLMGGLISNSSSDSKTGVPGLSRLPLLGRLFRTEGTQNDRTELIIMVTPYVISTHEEGWELTESVKQQLTLHGGEDDV